MPAQFVLGEGVLDTDLLGPIIIVTASATLGGLSGDSTALVTHLSSASAPLGALSATANTQPESPSEASLVASHRFIQPNFPVLPQETKITKVLATANAALGQMLAQGLCEITFSIVEDDAEALLLI